METPTAQLNRVELTGIVGSVHVTELLASRFARLSVATSFAYRDREGFPVIETTWSDCLAWQGKGISRQDIDALAKGDTVHLVGRMRNHRHTTPDGTDLFSTEIVVSSLERIEASELPPMEE